VQTHGKERRSILHYDLLEKVGQGGMGVVYRAHDRKLERIVALKFLHENVLDSPPARKRFIQEAHAVSRLNHRHIAIIHAIEEVDDQVFLVFEYLPGGTLRSRLADLQSRGEVMRPEHVAIYGAQVADALSHAHAAGIIHRDVKPGNILFANDGDLKLVDFGVASRHDLARLTETGTQVGTPLYMSPEQALGREVDERSDIFSVGIVLFEMATGRPPFTSENPAGIAHQIIHEPALPIRAHNLGFPAELDNIIQRALQKDPSARYGRMLELASTLGRFRDGGYARTDELSTETVRTETPPAVRSRRLLGLAMVVALISAFLIFKPQRLIYRGQSPPNQYLSEGAADLNRFYLRGNIEKAISDFGKAIQLSPKSAEPYAALSKAYREKYLESKDRQFLDEARQNAEKALALDGDSASAQVASAMVLADSGDRENAIATYRTALAKDPNDVEALRELATIYSSSGNMLEAEPLYAHAIKLGPNDWNTWSQAGVAYYRNQEYAQAEKDFRTVVNLAPDNQAAHRNLGAAAMALGNFGEAENEFKASASLAPTASAYSNLGALYIYQGRYRDAIDVMLKAIQLTSAGYRNIHVLWANLGEAYLYTPQHAKEASEAYHRAIQEVEKQLAFAPDDPNLLSFAAVYWAKLGERRQALDEIGRALSFAHGNRDVSFRAAVVYEVRGERDRALSALEDAIRGGYSLDEVGREPAFTALQQDRRYQQLIKPRSDSSKNATKERK
jgi:serine/threonine protein kinase/Tfp pilus assembly protein PilF